MYLYTPTLSPASVPYSSWGFDKVKLFKTPLGKKKTFVKWENNFYLLIVKKKRKRKLVLAYVKALFELQKVCCKGKILLHLLLLLLL